MTVGAGKQGSLLQRYGSLAALLVLGTLAFVFLLAAVIHPFAQWDRARLSGEQYYASLTAFNKDLNELDSLSQQYRFVPVRPEGFERKADTAANYSVRAKQAVTSWSYFQAFIRQEQAYLQRWKVDTVAALTRIESGRSVVRNTAGSIAAELEQLASGDPKKTARIADTLTTLRELSA